MQGSERRASRLKGLSQPIDRVAIATMLVLSIVIGILVLGGDHTSPKVRSFTWQDQQIGAEDTAFILSFNRPMDQSSVEQNLRLVPPLPGKFSWAGRRMAYTLEMPAPYGTAFEVDLKGARDRFAKPEDDRTIQPFVGRFRTRDRAFLYLGAEGQEEGRLILENLTRQEHRVLTPADLVVMDFQPYPEGDRILFSASDRTAMQQGTLDQKLYTVTTGIQPQAATGSALSFQTNEALRPNTTPQPAGVITQVLDSQDYQNLKFDLSPDGQKIIVQRVNRKNPGDFGIWLLQGDEPAKPLKTEPGGDFLIAPDSNSLAMSQGQGLAILPLESGAEPLDFLAKFGMILSFSNDGTTAATVSFNAVPLNPTKSLYVVDNQGKEKELVKTDGSILSAQFDPMKKNLYALITTRLPNDEVFLEQPYLVSINLKTGQRTELLKLPLQREIQMSLAPDSLGILLDQVVAANPDQASEELLQSDDGMAIATSRLWFLPIELDKDGNSVPVQPQQLPLTGLSPQWLP